MRAYVFQDKSADPNNEEDRLYYKLAYQCAVNYVSLEKDKRYIYDSRWDDASLNPSEEWRVFRALRDLDKVELLRMRYSLPHRNLKSIDGKRAYSSPKLIATI